MEIVKLSEYDVSMATHRLSCRHQICRTGFDYTMPCVVLGKTKSGKLKLLVFGNRYWMHKDHVKKIRYVSAGKVKVSKRRQ